MLEGSPWRFAGVARAMPLSGIAASLHRFGSHTHGRACFGLLHALGQTMEWAPVKALQVFDTTQTLAGHIRSMAGSAGFVLILVHKEWCKGPCTGERATRGFVFFCFAVLWRADGFDTLLVLAIRDIIL